MLDREDRRKRLRQLDTCLQWLEDAHERNETVVTREVASHLSARTGIVPGMLISRAIKQVMREQERYLRPLSADGTDEEGPRVVPLTEPEARALSARIRSANQHVGALLLEAYERKAAEALGYPSWRRYVKDEFGLSRSRSYELVDQARVIRALGEAAGMSEPPDISAYAARQIKQRLAGLIDTVRDRTAGARPESRGRIVLEVVEEERGRLEKGTSAAAQDAKHGLRVVSLDESAERPHADLSRVKRSMLGLVSLPDPADVVAEISDDDLDDWSMAFQVRRWMAEFVEHLDHRRSCVSDVASG